MTTPQNDNWKEELTLLYNYSETYPEEEIYRKDKKQMEKFISSLLTQQAEAMKQRMVVEIVTILDKDWKPADNLVGIIQMELLSVIKEL